MLIILGLAAVLVCTAMILLKLARLVWLLTRFAISLFVLALES